MQLYVIALFAMLSEWTSSSAMAQTRNADSEQLSKAIEYFQSGKYHEAMLILQPLDSRYKLNPRFRAYLGVCCYYEWDYENATRYLDESLGYLDVFAPHEQSIYYYCDAESHFQLEAFEKAIPLYERVVNVCYDNEKADVFFRLGFCYMSMRQWETAQEYFESAQAYYVQFGCPDDKLPRMEQLKKMIAGCAQYQGKD
ncbi:MAG: tetratricopeptide repeat protein [Prevotella sp.]